MSRSVVRTRGWNFWKNSATVRSRSRLSGDTPITSTASKVPVSCESASRLYNFRRETALLYCHDGGLDASQAMARLSPNFSSAAVGVNLKRPTGVTNSWVIPLSYLTHWFGCRRECSKPPPSSRVEREHGRRSFNAFPTERSAPFLLPVGSRSLDVFSTPTGFQLNTPLSMFKLSRCGPSPGCEVSRAHGVVR